MTFAKRYAASVLSAKKTNDVTEPTEVSEVSEVSEVISIVDDPAIVVNPKKTKVKKPDVIIPMAFLDYIHSQHKLGLVKTNTFNSLVKKANDKYSSHKYSPSQQIIVDGYSEYVNSIDEKNKELQIKYEQTILNEKRHKLDNSVTIYPDQVSRLSTIRELMVVTPSVVDLAMRKPLMTNNGETITTKQGNIVSSVKYSHEREEYDDSSIKALSVTDKGLKFNTLIKNGLVKLIQSVDVIERSESLFRVKAMVSIRDHMASQDLTITYDNRDQSVKCNGMVIGRITRVDQETVVVAKVAADFQYSQNVILKKMVADGITACKAWFVSDDRLQSYGDWITHIDRLPNDAFNINAIVNDVYYTFTISVKNEIREIPNILVVDNALRWVLDKNLLGYDEKFNKCQIFKKIKNTIEREIKTLTQYHHLTRYTIRQDAISCLNSKSRSVAKYNLENTLKGISIFNSDITLKKDSIDPLSLKSWWYSSIPLVNKELLGVFGIKLSKKFSSEREQSKILNLFTAAHLAFILPRELHYEPIFKVTGYSEVFSLNELMIKYLVTNPSNIKYFAKLLSINSLREVETILISHGKIRYQENGNTDIITVKPKIFLNQREINKLNNDNSWLGDMKRKLIFN